ncbi:hypothetical protein OUZ56_005695 [Daphnia magna]|uniref:Transmembrane protein n=1 Tax=Daphnia magna TaxID=35525 RepID=A0ABQ9YTI9_9CRUS|nr:hypothetical protein OUZ56_005695 [Daphnia magna]
MKLVGLKNATMLPISTTKKGLITVLLAALHFMVYLLQWSSVVLRTHVIWKVAGEIGPKRKRTGEIGLKISSPNSPVEMGLGELGLIF